MQKSDKEIMNDESAVDFYNQMTALMGGGKAVDVACHDLSKGFSTVSCDMR